MVGAMIDSAEANIRLAMQNFINGKLYTIDRGAAGLPDSTPSNISSTLFNLNGTPIVIACPMPLCGLSGATTTTSPSLYRFYQIAYTRRRYTIIIRY